MQQQRITPKSCTALHAVRAAKLEQLYLVAEFQFSTQFFWLSVWQQQCHELLNFQCAVQCWNLRNTGRANAESLLSNNAVEQFRPIRHAAVKGYFDWTWFRQPTQQSIARQRFRTFQPTYWTPMFLFITV